MGIAGEPPTSVRSSCFWPGAKASAPAASRLTSVLASSTQYRAVRAGAGTGGRSGRVSRAAKANDLWILLARKSRIFFFSRLHVNLESKISFQTSVEAPVKTTYSVPTPYTYQLPT
jgi:hypothetical protein